MSLDISNERLAEVAEAGYAAQAALAEKLGQGKQAPWPEAGWEVRQHWVDVAKAALGDGDNLPDAGTALAIVFDASASAKLLQLVGSGKVTLPAKKPAKKKKAPTKDKV